MATAALVVPVSYNLPVYVFFWQNANVNQADSTSRPSSRESERTVSSASSTTSVVSETAGKVVSETLDWAAASVGELISDISRWEAEKHEEDSSPACHTHQKLERKLQKFFALRRVFAEYEGQTPEVKEEDQITEMD